MLWPGGALVWYQLWMVETVSANPRPINLRRTWAADLDAATLYRLLRLRAEIFVVEQKCAYLDPDGKDLLAETRHLWLEDDGEIVASLRLLEEHKNGIDSFHIGRVCTATHARGHGHTTRLMRAALAEVGAAPCHLAAQAYLIDMYARYGFVVDGPRFLDAGVMHVPMTRGH